MKALLSLLFLFPSPPGPGGSPSPLSEIYRRVRPALVQVLAPGGFRGLPSRGSGVIVSPSGLVLTFYTAVFEEGQVRAALPGGREVPVRVAARAPSLGAALLQLPGKGPFPFVKLPPPGWKPGPGLPVLQVSYPFRISGPGDPPSAFFGLVKARLRLDLRLKLRDFPLKRPVLLTGTPSNPGAQGGGLFDMEGRLVGMVGRAVEAAETNTYVNYALPVDLFREFVASAGAKKPPAAPSSRASKPGRPPFLGIRLLDMGFHSSPPAYIDKVIPRSPAARAGLRPDDLVLEIDGKPVRTCAEYRKVLKSLVPGKPVLLIFKRKREIRKVRIVPAPPKGRKR